MVVVVVVVVMTPWSLELGSRNRTQIASYAVRIPHNNGKKKRRFEFEEMSR